MEDIAKLTPFYSVSPQLTEDEIGILTARGFPSVINNRPDGEGLESLETIAGRPNADGVTFHLSEVKSPAMDTLERSDFLEHFTGEMFLSQYAAMEKLDPATIRLADERRLRRPDGIRRSEGPEEPNLQGARAAAGETVAPDFAFR